MTVRHSKLTRRDFCSVAGATITSVVFGSACSRLRESFSPYEGRLTVRPPSTTVSPSKSGKIMLGLDDQRDAILQIPQTSGQSALPLLMMLHGATQNADQMFWYLGSAHEEAGVVVLAPNSRETTWDAIGGNFGPDVYFLNRALQSTFEIVPIDPTRIAIGGFSDGATYAISLGLINGDLFRNVAAFSPGFVIDGTPNGKPRFFISHGTRDHILPIDSCGRRVAAGLKSRGYNVTFREFDGDHEIPAAVARDGLRWVASQR